MIETWLREDQRLGVTKKQRHTAVRIHERLKEEFPDEFHKAESTVRFWVGKLRNNLQEAFIPLTAEAGEQAEVDFGRVVIRIKGKPTDVHMFVMRLRYSGVIFAMHSPQRGLRRFWKDTVLRLNGLAGPMGVHCNSFQLEINSRLHNA